MRHWPFWLSIALTAILGAMWLAGWHEALGWIVLALTLGPLVYVIVVIAFFNDWRPSGRVDERD
ncbi:hypothetical protein [Microbacterium sp.]|uniref:hypothetical protein n=1 Tax=Microbacterium sp. TaxID=51671 RepID=UPI0039E60C96